MSAVAFVDGGNRGCPGHHACAAVLLVDGEIVQEEARYLGPSGTNNIAEYGGLILALEMAIAGGITDLTIRSDSKLIVEQVLGNWRIKDKNLAALNERAQSLGRQIPRLGIKHVPREQNRIADQLCTDLLDAVSGKKRK